MEVFVLTLIIVSMIWYFALLLEQLHFRNVFYCIFKYEVWKMSPHQHLGKDSLFSSNL